MWLSLTAVLSAQTFSLKQVTVKQAISEVEGVTGYSFVYSTRDIKTDAIVSVNAQSLEEAVRQILAGQDVVWQIEGKSIIVKPSDKQSPSKTSNSASFTVTGTVVDEKGEPLAGAVISADSKTGVVSDIDGRYTIKLTSGQAVIKVSYLSYATQEIVVGGRNKINVSMVPDASNTLNDVVVIGYGTTKKADLTGSVAAVNMQDLEQGPVTSIDQALQGRIAGMDIMNTSGEPGASTSIRIRGTRSINASNEPLIVLDGVIDAVNDMSEINAADIESITVMKDASSTAIYGSRGANGVILITTRKGVTSKPSVTAKAEFGLSQIARTIDYMNKDEMLRYLNDWYFFRGITYNDKTGVVTLPTTAPRFDPADYEHDTDWLKEITRLAPYQNYALSVSGKVADKFNYFGSLSYNDTEGIIKNSGSQRFTGRFNASYDFAKWLTVGLKASLSYRADNNNKANIGGTSFWDGAIYLAPYIGPEDTVNPLYENGTEINTPISNINLITKKINYITGNTTLDFTIRPCRGLVIKSQNSLMIYQRKDYSFWPSTQPARKEGQGGDAYRYEGDALKFSSENTITYSKKFSGGHYFDAMAGFSAVSDNTNAFSLKGVGLLSDGTAWNNIEGISSKENLTPHTQNQKVVRESVFARINYNYKQRYYLTITGRGDASSNFADNNKWGFFPSAALKWAVKKENFMKGVRWMDDLSIRLSAGRTGNDAIPYYRSLAAYGTTSNGYIYDGAQGTAVYPDRIANPNLTWEKTDLYNVALDMLFFKGRLGVTLEGYHSTTSDLLLNVQVLQSTGYNSRLTNIGKTTNTGFELTIDSKNIEKKNFGWSTQLTMTHNKQMVKDIGAESYVSVLNSPGNTPFMMYGYKAGYPLNSLWGFQYAGVWHNFDEVERNNYTRSYVSNTTNKYILGFPKYVDQDHDGVLTENDLIYLGNSDPVLYGGFQNTFHFWKFRLGIYFTYSLGGKIYNYSELSMAGTFSSNQYRYMAEAWHPVRNPDSDYPRAGTDDRMLASSFMVHDASYLRLKDLNLSYTLDLSKYTRHLRDLTFGFSCSNVFLVSKYNGFDPDVSTSKDDSTLRRVDMGAYPQSRMYIFSIQLRY